MILRHIEQFFEIDDDPIPPNADVAIGVGIDVSSDYKKASPQSAAVAEKCAELFLNGKVKCILLSGAYPQNKEFREADAMKQVIQNKVPTERIFLDRGPSYRTYGNADNSLIEMKKHAWTSAIVVAQQLHARRVKSTFQKSWVGSKLSFYVIKARSKYGGGSTLRLKTFWNFLVWDSLAFIYSKFRGHA